VESEKYDTLTVNELFSKLKSADVDRGMTTKIEGPTDSHSLALIGGSKGKADTNPSTMMFSLSSLTSMPDEEFDVLGEDELALLMRRFERLHENRVNMRRNTRTCFKCSKAGHYFAECPKVNMSYGPPWAHYLGGYQDRLLGGPLGLPDLRCTVPDGVKHKDYRGEVLG
jgi:hypothetical protein